MQNREEWLRGRKHYLGGSDIAAILGLSSYKSAVDIYLEKTSDNINNDTTSQPARWGILLEDIIAKEYSHITG